MNKNSLANGAPRLALIVIGLAIASGPAIAQEVKEVIVEAPRAVVRKVERTNTGAPVEILTLTRRVSYADLDLSKSADAATLETRINDTAKDSCTQLDKMIPLLGRSDDGDCVKKAVDGAMVQAKAAIAAAQK